MLAHSYNMGSASSAQRGGKVTRSQTVLKESTNADIRKDIPQVVRTRWGSFHSHALNFPQAANIAKDNLHSPNIEVCSYTCIMPSGVQQTRRIFSTGSQEGRCDANRGACSWYGPPCPGLKSRLYRARALLCPPYPRRRMHLQQTSARHFSCRDRL